MVKLAPRPRNLFDEFFSDFPRGLSIAPLPPCPIPASSRSM